VAGMKKTLLILMAVALVGCGGGDEDEGSPTGGLTEGSNTPGKTAKGITDPIVEKAIRKELKKPTGELTESVLAKVTSLDLIGTKITDVGLKEVAKLPQLTHLWLDATQITDVGLKELAKLQKLERLDLVATKATKAGVAELQKALPKCRISGP